MRWRLLRFTLPSIPPVWLNAGTMKVADDIHVAVASVWRRNAGTGYPMARDAGWNDGASVRMVRRCWSRTGSRWQSTGRRRAVARLFHRFPARDGEGTSSSSVIPMREGVSARWPEQLPLPKGGYTTPSSELPLRDGVCPMPRRRRPLLRGECAKSSSQRPMPEGVSAFSASSLPLPNGETTLSDSQLHMPKGVTVVPSGRRPLRDGECAMPSSEHPFSNGGFTLSRGISLFSRWSMPIRWRAFPLACSPAAGRRRTLHVPRGRTACAFDPLASGSADLPVTSR